MLTTRQRGHGRRELSFNPLGRRFRTDAAQRICIRQRSAEPFGANARRPQPLRNHSDPPPSGPLRQHLPVTSEPGATVNGSPISAFIRKHLALLLGGVPLALAGIRLVVVSQGDPAVMAALIQTLNLSTVLVYAVTTAGPGILFFLLLALGTGGGDWLPRQDRWRKFWAFVCVMYAVVLLLAVSWKMAASLIGLGAAMVVIGLVARRWDDAMPIISTPAVAIGLVFGALLQVGLWLPIERITLKDGSARVGYVLNAADPIVILWREGGLVYLKQANVSDRQPCTDGSTGPGLDDLVRESTPSCPKAKVTPPGK